MDSDVESAEIVGGNRSSNDNTDIEIEVGSKSHSSDKISKLKSDKDFISKGDNFFRITESRCANKNEDNLETPSHEYSYAFGIRDHMNYMDITRSTYSRPTQVNEGTTAETPFAKCMPEFSFVKHSSLHFQTSSLFDGSKLKLNFPSSDGTTVHGEILDHKPSSSVFTINNFDIPSSDLCSNSSSNNLYGPLAVLPYENRDLQRKFIHYKQKIKHIRNLLHRMKPREKHLRSAASLNNTELVKRFLDEGIDPNCVDSRRRTPLHIAASKGYKDVIKLLLHHRADPNQKDSIGNTPLHLAACTSHVETVTLLLEAGTNVKLADNQGFSPFNLANARLNVLQKLRQNSPELKNDVLKIIEMMKAYMKSTGNTGDAETLASLTDKLTLTESCENCDDDFKSLLSSLQDLTLNRVD